MPINNYYSEDLPSDQNAVDIFKGEWASEFPAPYNAHIKAGGTPLFQDGRIVGGVEAAGGIEGKSVLELGTLEGSHTYVAIY